MTIVDDHRDNYKLKLHDYNVLMYVQFFNKKLGVICGIGIISQLPPITCKQYMEIALNGVNGVIIWGIAGLLIFHYDYVPRPLPKGKGYSEATGKLVDVLPDNFEMYLTQLPPTAVWDEGDLYPPEYLYLDWDIE